MVNFELTAGKNVNSIYVPSVNFLPLIILKLFKTGINRVIPLSLFKCQVNIMKSCLTQVSNFHFSQISGMSLML